MRGRPVCCRVRARRHLHGGEVEAEGGEVARLDAADEGEEAVEVDPALAVLVHVPARGSAAGRGRGVGLAAGDWRRGANGIGSGVGGRWVRERCKRARDPT